MWWRRLRVVLAVVALSTLATCPIGIRACRGEQRSIEAEELLAYLAARVQDAWRATGKLPATSVGPTPSPGACCDNGGTCDVDVARWQEPGWPALHFTIDGPHRYAYSYQVIEGGRAAIVRATGDLDCDGSFGTFEGRLDPDGERLRITWTSTNPSE